MSAGFLPSLAVGAPHFKAGVLLFILHAGADASADDPSQMHLLASAKSNQLDSDMRRFINRLLFAIRSNALGLQGGASIGGFTLRFSLRSHEV